MRVLQIHNRQSAQGGADVVMAAEATDLESRGHVVSQWSVDTAREAEKGALRLGANAVWNGGALREIESVLDEFQPDLMHVHTPFPVMSPAVLRTAAPRSIGLVATMHSFRYSCIKATLVRDGTPCTLCVGRHVKLPAIRHRCYHNSWAASVPLAASLSLHRSIGTFGRIDRLIALSEFSRSLAVREGFDPARVVVKPNAVPDPGAPSMARTGRALFVGRLVEEKGIDSLVQAWENRALPPLDVVGDGPLAALVERARDRGSNIRLMGGLQRSEVWDLIRSASMLVLPSIWYEAGAPLVMLESFAAGTPVVASDIGNFSNYLEDGINGALFRSGDPASLAAAVDRLTSLDAALVIGAARATYDGLRDAADVAVLEGIYHDAIGQARTR